jgi:lipoprotein LprG
MTARRSHRLLPLQLAAALALLLTLALAACGGGDDDEAPATATPEPAALLQSAATRMEQVRSLHFLLEHEHGATKIVRGIAMTEAEGDLVAPDRMQATIKGSLGPVDFDSGIVIIGKDGWLQNPITHRWDDEDITIDQVFDPQNGVVGLVRSARSPAITKIEEVDGVDCYRVDATLDSGDLTLLPGSPQAGRSVPTVAWVGVKDPLVHRIEIRGPVASGESKDLVRTLTLSRFDEDVSIAPPD